MPVSFIHVAIMPWCEIQLFQIWSLIKIVLTQYGIVKAKVLCLSLCVECCFSFSCGSQKPSREARDWEASHLQPLLALTLERRETLPPHFLTGAALLLHILILEPTVLILKQYRGNLVINKQNDKHWQVWQPSTLGNKSLNRGTNLSWSRKALSAEFLERSSSVMFFFSPS